MVKLTPIGKITIVLVGVLVFYFLFLPILLGFFFPSENIERKKEIKVVAFLKTFDRESAKLQETLRKIKKDQDLQGLVGLNLVNVDAEPGKVEQHNVERGEVPCFILGNEKYSGWYSEQWFKEKILSLSDQNKPKNK